MVMGGMAMMAGYLWGHLRGGPVFEEREVVAFLRRNQLRKLGLGWTVRSQEQAPDHKDENES